MFGRKAKSEPVEQTPDRRKVQRGNVPPAFSYYSNRIFTPAPSEKRTIAKKTPVEPTSMEKPKSSPRTRSFFAGLSFWLMLAVAIICAVKVLALSSNPKIIVVDSNLASVSYIQTTSVYTAASQKLLESSVTNRSKLTVDTRGISQKIKDEFPELTAVSMSIPLISNRPVIYIQPATPSIVLQSVEGNYVLNSMGDVLAKTNSLPEGVPLLVDQSGLTPRPGKQVVPSGTISFAQAIEYQFSAAHLTISTFVLPQGSPYELDVRLESRPYAIRFNLESSAMTQSGAAIAAIQQIGNTVPADYIDVRVPGRVYYK